MLNVTIMFMSSATGSLPETSPCNHHSKEETVCTRTMLQVQEPVPVPVCPL